MATVDVSDMLSSFALPSLVTSVQGVFDPSCASYADLGELWVARSGGTNVYREGGPPTTGTDPMLLSWDESW